LFIGRVDELVCIEKCLADGSKERSVFVLYGLGGAGKTQLALKFVELHKDQ
jgi:tRNA A37 threonylcarbamoyladenosine biosynthesis protein TsaE